VIRGYRSFNTNSCIPHALKPGMKVNPWDFAQKPRVFLRLAQDGERSRTIAFLSLNGFRDLNYSLRSRFIEAEINFESRIL
ncbi:MAG: hypothetical protein KAJ14_05785, partial [Candidatus Omnitrophica bacterium]|nr:hypothetical protein [Candidatus Omnitrophota bacterium]